MQHLAKAIQTQRDFCTDAKNKTVVKERKYRQRTMDACGLKDVLESHKKGWGWMCGRVETEVLGLSYIFRTRLQETYIVLFPVKLQGISHLVQLTLQIWYLLLLLQQPWQTTWPLKMHVNTRHRSQSMHKIIHHVSCNITHKVWNSGEGTAVQDCCWRTGIQVQVI